MNKVVDFVTSKLTAQQNQTIANVLMFTGIIINLFDIMQNGFTLNWLPILLAIGFVGVGFIYQLLFVRCPNCNQRLDVLPQK